MPKVSHLIMTNQLLPPFLFFFFFLIFTVNIIQTGKQYEVLYIGVDGNMVVGSKMAKPFKSSLNLHP